MMQTWQTQFFNFTMLVDDVRRIILPDEYVSFLFIIPCIFGIYGLVKYYNHLFGGGR